jgi:hypothetical protein
MGNTSSTANATLSSKNVIVNTTALNDLNTQITNTAVNSMISIASNCGSALTQSQQAQFGNITLTGNATATVNQQQLANMNFSCLQQESIQQSLVATMASTINNAIQSNSSTALLNSLNAAIANKTQSDFASTNFGGTTTNTATAQAISNYVKNNSTATVSNVIRNSVYGTFKNTIANNCIAKVVQAQNISVSNLTASDNAQFLSSQAQNASLLTNCVQNTNIVNQVVNDLTSFSGLTVTSQSGTEISNTAKAELESSAVASGLFEGVATAIASIGTALGSIFGLSGLGLPLGVSSGSVCLCIICIVIIYFAMNFSD